MIDGVKIFENFSAFQPEYFVTNIHEGTWFGEAFYQRTFILYQNCRCIFSCVYALQVFILAVDCTQIKKTPWFCLHAMLLFNIVFLIQKSSVPQEKIFRNKNINPSKSCLSSCLASAQYKHKLYFPASNRCKTDAFFNEQQLSVHL